MSHNIQERDLQISTTQAWHGLTTIRETVTLEEALPYEVVPCAIYHKVPQVNEAGITEEVFMESPSFKQLLATDDWLPVGEPFAPSYHPSSIAQFTNLIVKGMGDTPYEIISAGSVDDRRKIFASLKVTDGFMVGDRKFEDYINILDSFDKSASLVCRYNSFCVVCANTYAASMQMGKEVGKAKHTLSLDINIERLIAAIDAFAGTSAHFKALLQEADAAPCSRDEARAWITGVEGRNVKETTNGMLQKSARMLELFENGKGNQGRTRLDAASAVTEFFTHESTNRKSDNAQFLTSEFGSSASTKTYVMEGLSRDWDKHVKHGELLLLS